MRTFPCKKAAAAAVSALTALTVTACSGGVPSDFSGSSFEKSAPQSSLTDSTASEAQTSDSSEESGFTETFLVGLDGKTILTSEVTMVWDEDAQPTSTLTEDFFRAVCDGFAYVYEPTVNAADDSELFGEPAESTEYRRINVGDKYGSLTVKSASATFQNTKYFGGDFNPNNFPTEHFEHSFVEFEGEIVLTGYLDVWEDSTNYPDSSARMLFFPHSTISVLPATTAYWRDDIGYYHACESHRVSFGDDIGTIDLGKFDDYSLDFQGIGKGDSQIEVKLALDSVSISWNNSCYANIVDMERI